MKMIINRFSKRFAMVILLCTLMTSFMMFTDMTPFSTSHVYAAVQATYYVSTDGSDSYPGTLSQPFATIQKARDVVRMINSNMTGDIIVYIKAGNYNISSPVTFNESDSGTNGYKIYYKNYDGIGSARFFGGQAVTGWTLYSGNIYRANVGATWTFSELSENGVKAVKARTPNVNSDYGITTTCQGAYLQNETYDDNSKTVFKYKSGDLNPTGWVLPGMQVHIFSGGYYNWSINLKTISSVDTANRLITLGAPTTYALPANCRYFVQGDLSLLDAPGEYYLDRSTGYLYYYPRSTPIANQTIIAPKVRDIFRFVGSSETQLVKNVQVEGFTLECTDFVENETGNLFSIENASIFMKNTEYITVKNCHIKNSGLNGILMKYYNKYNTIYGNLIENSGIAGIYVKGYMDNEAGRSNCNRDHVIKNNKIVFVGMHDVSSAGVIIDQSGHNEISHNYCAYSPRWLLAGYCTNVNVLQADAYFENNSFTYNEVYKGCEDSADTSPVYMWGEVYSTQGNTIDQLKLTTGRWNSYSGLSTPPQQGIWGVYLDDHSNYWTIKNCYVTDVPNDPYFAHNSSGHTVTNCSWQSGFNNNLVDYKNIGLLPDFPTVYLSGGYIWINDNDVAVAYNGTWTYRNDAPVADDFTGDEHYTTTAGAYAQYTFTGTDVKWVASTSSNRGKADVYIDNVFDSVVDLYTYDPIRQNTVYSKEGLSQGQHTIKIVVRSDKNPNSGGYYVVVDAIGYKSVSYLFYDGFENGFNNWSTVCGTPSVSTTQKHNGSNSYVINEDMDVIQHSMGSNTNKVAVIWFYDDASDTSMQTTGFVDNSTTPVAIGVETSTSTTKYVYRIGGSWAATNINRTTGWHKFVWDYRTGTDFKLYIDDSQVAVSTAVTSFNRIYIGDAWSGTTGTVYFDDVSVQDDLP